MDLQSCGRDHPAGAPSTVAVHVKNGWLQRSTHGWRVHSLGTFNTSRPAPPREAFVTTAPQG
ncbi:hypothetical protein [Streptomyces sp. NRRL F-2799]|uniref:hypothetical protein n=1 Tax=Streptomyces sp. NRRL F-2799 TaxID=1463844 RepID=UPI00099B6976|nr:hypothetical protein [Streptomyces sp. NRRL F-2799]